MRKIRLVDSISQYAAAPWLEMSFHVDDHIDAAISHPLVQKPVKSGPEKTALVNRQG